VIPSLGSIARRASVVIWLALGPGVTIGPAQQAVDAGEAHGSSDEQRLNLLIQRLGPVLDANRKELVGRTGSVRGFGAGSIYPQIWLRDSATLLPLARYRYPRAFLESWIEEHLAHQEPGGELHDWIAVGEPERFRADAPRVRAAFRHGTQTVSADRNTTMNDQESSAVLAAAQAFRVTGDRAWLRKPIAGRPLIQRLDAALASAWKRGGEKHGLVTSAFTADWGDVSPVHPDQRVIYLDETTPVVVALYTNVLFCEAARELAFLWNRLGRADRARPWTERVARMRANLNRSLWQEERGFYRSHRLVERRGFPEFDDSDLFAMGGNAVAALYGVASNERAGRIFAAAEERRRRFGVTTIAGVLLPPYPAGFFKHPIMRDPYAYQNGGQWDWFAGRLLLAEFRRGHAETARKQLEEIAGRIVGSGGFHEWYTREGQGRGSATYAGSAGALAAAIFQGLFGVDLRADGLDLRVRLGGHPGEVRLREPATGHRVEYRYRLEGQPHVLRLGYESNVPGMGTVAVLLPHGATPRRVRLDGKPRRHRLETVGSDRYVLVSTDWKRHELEVETR
jgi:hypothetical protein